LGCLDALLAATLAPACAACRAPLDSPSRSCICPACLGSIVPAALAPWASAHITIGMAGGRYEGALRDIIHAFKYEGRRSLADVLASVMRESGRQVLEDCDCVVPVPLHPWRRMRRGFNQARDLAERLDRPVVDALWRVRATASQMTLAADARQRNVSGAFMLAPWSPSIDDRIVVLVDDVRTTGETLEACARVLAGGGARAVRGLTVAAAEKSVIGRAATITR
jgi:ComF family protein